MPELIKSQDDFLGDLLKRIRKLEGNAVSGASPVVGASIPGGVGNFEVTNLLTIDNLQVFKDTGDVLLYSNGHTTPTNVAVPTGDYINVFASKISPLDHVTVMSDPILFFDQGILIEKDVETFGAFMSASDPYKGFGGGAVMLGHGFENVNDPPRLNMTDNDFHELAITAGSSLVGGVWSQANLDAVLADVRLRVLTSKVGTGTAPFNVASTTLCTNLNADKLDGYHASDFSAVDVNGYISIAGIHFGSGYPDLYRNIVNSVKFVECSGNVIIDGSLNVGDGLAVTGAIANTGYITTGGSGDVGSAFQIINSTKTGLGTDWRIYNMTGAYGDSLQFWCYGGTGWGAKFIMYDDGAWSTQVSKTDINSVFFCASLNFNGITETGYPTFGRNLVGSTKLLECSGDILVDGNMTVGNVSGGLSVTGVIGMTGTGANSYLQYGTGSGSMRLAKTAAGVISLQEYVSSTWQLGTLNTGNIFVDHINSASAGGIYLFDHLRFYNGTSGLKLYDSANLAPANYFLATNSTGYPVWVPATSTWNGGTITNPTTFSYNANVYSDINVYGCFRAVHQYTYAGALTTFTSAGGILSAYPLYTVMIDGKQWWGSGLTAQDTNLYRNIAYELRTDVNLTIGGAYLVMDGASTSIYLRGLGQAARVCFGAADDCTIARESAGLLATQGMLLHGDCIVSNGAWYNIYIEGLAPVIHFGDRASAWDTFLSRPSAGVLATQGCVEVYESGRDTASYGFLGVTRAATNANNSYIVMTKQSTLVWGLGINDASHFILGLATSGRTIPIVDMELDWDGNVAFRGGLAVGTGKSIGDSNGAVFCASINYNGGSQTGFPILGRNTISSIKVVECTGDMVIDGNMTVGTVSGGLSVTGTIASTGSYFQIGAAGAGAMRLAKTAAGVFSVQEYVTSTWQLGTLNAGNVFVDHINSASAGGIYLFDHLRFYNGTAGVKLYDSTNSAPANYYLATDSSGYPVWVTASSFAWNGGTVTSNIQISKTQPYLDVYYSGIREWKVGMLDSGSPTFSIIEQSGSKGLNIDGNGLLTVFGNITSQGYLETTMNSQVLPASGTGMRMFWNFSGSLGEGDFFNIYNTPNAGTGGFRFYQKTAASTYLQLASLDAAGNMVLAGSVTVNLPSGATSDQGLVLVKAGGYGATALSEYYTSSTNYGLQFNTGSGYGIQFNWAQGRVIVSGGTAIDSNEIHSGYYTQGDGTELYINYYSYMNTLSYYRDTVVCDGKGNRVATFSGAGNFLKVNSLLIVGTTARLYNSATGVLQVQDGNGDLGTLDASMVFTDHINSASATGIYFMDSIKGYSANRVEFASNVNANGVCLTGGWLSYADATHSEISNDITTYYSLMLVGNSSVGDGVRRVAVWDELTVNGSQILTGNLFLQGTAYCYNDVFVGYGAAADAHIHRANVGVLQVLDANGALGTWEASNIKADHWTASSGSEMYFMNHLRAYSALNIMPNANASGNIGGNGVGANYYWGAVYANYLEYKTSHGAFDALDDLTLVKNYKTKTVQVKGVDTEIIDDETLPFLKNEEGFFETGRSVGFLLGCAKFSALKHEELEKRIADLEEQLKKLNGGA